MMFATGMPEETGDDRGNVLMSANPSGARQGILSLAVKDKAALYHAYMPYLKNGGIFVPTGKRYFLGDEVFLLLTLPESSERLPVAGKVVWVTPIGAQGNRTAGVGVQFADTSEGDAVKGKIEALLAGTLGADKPTHTM
jgi:type IV pilus assembly protein PilZ